jgi:hypothetical protein
MSDEGFIELGKRYGLRFLGSHLVVHYQIADEAVEKLTDVMKAVMALKTERWSNDFIPAGKG